MAILKLYGFPMSGCTKRVGTVLMEKKISFEFYTVDLFKGENKVPGYMKKQPFGQVPYIDDDGFILFESRAICRYLQAKYPDQGTPLVPAASDLKGTALFEQACSIEAHNFDPFAQKATFEKLTKKMRGMTPDEDVFNSLIAQLDGKLEAMNVILEKQKYIAGNVVSLADLFFLSYGNSLNATGSNIMKKWPNVDRWFTELSSRPSWTAVAGGVKSTSF